MDTTFLADSMSGVSAHAMSLAAACVALVLFIAIYVMVTPYKEFTLIREGNSAAAISLGGAIIGYTLPLAKSVAQSESMNDLMLWAGVALIAQLIAYGVARLTFKQLASDVVHGKHAPAIFLATVSIAIGLLNAAAMTE
jgi:putative membrane protein